MCSAPRLETSNPSIRIGSCSRRARPRAPRARRPAAGSGARGASGPARAPASRCARRLPQTGACRRAPPPAPQPSRRAGSRAPARGSVRSRIAGPSTTSRGTDGAAVVLGDELLGHLRLVALGAVVEIEAGVRRTPSNLEHLRVGIGAVDSDADQIRGTDHIAGDPLALHQRPDSGEPVAVGRRALELLCLGGGGHLPLEVALDLAVATREEVHDRLDVATVLVAVDVPDARRLTSLDVVIETGHAGARPGSGPRRSGTETACPAGRASREPASRSRTARSRRGWDGGARA